MKQKSRQDVPFLDFDIFLYKLITKYYLASSFICDLVFLSD